MAYGYTGQSLPCTKLLDTTKLHQIFPWFGKQD